MYFVEEDKSIFQEDPIIKATLKVSEKVKKDKREALGISKNNHLIYSKKIPFYQESNRTMILKKEKCYLKEKDDICVSVYNCDSELLDDSFSINGFGKIFQEHHNIKNFEYLEKLS